jgi:RND superfamily putative drug exporter
VLATLSSVDWSWKSAIPALEHVAEKNSVSLIADAAGGIAMKRMGKLFGESDSGQLRDDRYRGQQPLGEDTRTTPDSSRTSEDPQHVEHVQDLWGDRLTSSSVQSPDGKAAYVQINLAGNQGTPLGEASVAAVRKIVERTPPPPGVQAYVTGQAPLPRICSTAETNPF